MNFGYGRVQIAGFVWHIGNGWFIRWGDWSIAWLEDDGHRPLSEQYGTTRTWVVGKFQLRRDGDLIGEMQGKS